MRPIPLPLLSRLLLATLVGLACAHAANTTSSRGRGLSTSVDAATISELETAIAGSADTIVLTGAGEAMLEGAAGAGEAMLESAAGAGEAMLESAQSAAAAVGLGGAVGREIGDRSCMTHA